LAALYVPQPDAEAPETEDDVNSHFARSYKSSKSHWDQSDYHKKKL